MRIECNNVTKQYHSKIAVDHLNLQLEAGKIYALLGPNGCGKSTLMKMIIGLVKPTSGHLLYEGEEIDYHMRSDIAFMPTDFSFFSYMRCLDAAKYYKDFFNDFDLEIFSKLLSEMDLSMDMKCSELSSGMTAKLKIALTMARRSSVIMLDEPLNGIDIVARDHVLSAIINHLNTDTTVLISSHLVDELETIVDDAIIMNNGRIVTNCTAEELRDKSNLSIADLYRDVFTDSLYKEDKDND